MGLECFLDIADGEMRIPPIASQCVVHGSDLPGFILRVRSDDGDLAAGPAEAGFRGWRQAKQLPGLADLDDLFRNDFKLVVLGRYQSAVLSRRMVNSMAPSGSSRHLSTSLI